jgi:hypothetical protein
MKDALIIDIETLAAAPEKLKKLMPVFEGKKGTKDPLKIEAQIDEKREAWLEKAALNADTCVIALIGMKWSGGDPFVLRSDTPDGEAGMLRAFWDIINVNLPGHPYDSSLRMWSCLVGHHLDFDIPVLIRRSWCNGIKPDLSRIKPGHGRYWAENILDTETRWCLNVKGESIKLNELALGLGVGQKSGDGSQFGDLWAKDKEAAIRYCMDDVVLTEKCAEMMW